MLTPASIESILTGQCKLDKARPVVAGVSGGPDSLCLLLLLQQAGWRVVAAHFNHMLRPEADEEALAVEKLARSRGIPFAAGRGDVAGHAAARKLSIETAARELRYRFLFAQAEEHGAQAVAVGHTADDQVETVLMHFIRGAGLNGLKGMPYRSILRGFDEEIPLVRPLLDAWRADTVAYCEANKVKPHYDASNASLDFLRNRVRNELIPLMETNNPQFREAVWRSGKTLTADHEILKAALEPVWRRAVQRKGARYVSLKEDVLMAEPTAVRVHILRETARELIPEEDIGYEDLLRAANFARDSAQDRVDFAGGLWLLREGGLLHVAVDVADLPTDQWPQMPKGMDSLALSIPGSVLLGDGWQFTIQSCDAAELESLQPWKAGQPFETFLDTGSVPDALELRVRRTGDRFEPLGMGRHSQKLSDFFVNAKLPRRARRRWPLICAGEQVIWVPGYRPGERYKLKPDSQGVLLLALKPPK